MYPSDISLQNYYYGHQIKRYIVQFMAVFSGLKVAIGKNDYKSQTNLVEVPIAYGSKDRVVAAILAENSGTNKPIRVPTLAANMSGIDLVDELRVGTGQTSTKTKLPLGETLPDGLVTVRRDRPIPYKMRMELSLYASNTEQHVQMLEQILMLFDPILQVQISDAAMDWTKITTITLENIGFEETYPSGTQRRIITSVLDFSFPIQLSPPYNYKKDYIKAILLRLDTGALDFNGMPVETAQEIADAAAREQPPTGYETLVNVDDLDIPPK